MTIRYEANPPKILPDVDTDQSIKKFIERIKDISKKWHLDKKFSPKMKNKSRSMLIKGWEKAVKRALIN